MTTKQRAYLKSLAMTMEPIFQVGKNSITPELVGACLLYTSVPAHPGAGCRGSERICPPDAGEHRT